MSVGGGDVEDTIRRSRGRFDESRVKSIGYSGRFILLRRESKLWAYIGPNGDYLLVEGLYCSCGSFTRSVTRSPSCIHVVALEEAKSSGRYRVLDVPEEVLVSIAWELLTVGYSKRLREWLYKQGGLQRKQRGPQGD